MTFSALFGFWIFSQVQHWAGLREEAGLLSLLEEGQARGSALLGHSTRSLQRWKALYHRGVMTKKAGIGVCSVLCPWGRSQRGTAFQVTVITFFPYSINLLLVQVLCVAHRGRPWPVMPFRIFTVFCLSELHISQRSIKKREGTVACVWRVNQHPQR